jgi:hypothetical protein
LHPLKGKLCVYAVPSVSSAVVAFVVHGGEDATKVTSCLRKSRSQCLCRFMQVSFDYASRAANDEI